MIEWQPIEQAPKDGSWFLTYEGDAGMVWGEYDFAYYCKDRKGFYITDTSEPSVSKYFALLPKPPQ